MNEQSKEDTVSRNTMPHISFQLEEGVKRQLQQVITEFVDSYQYAQRIWMDERTDHPYEYYMKVEPLNWSDEMISDVANSFLSKTIGLFTDIRFQEEMADDLNVLLNEEKSNRWLCRIAKAERSSVAYERALRLIGDGNNICHNVVAREIMQHAADAGDELCALRLIESTYAQLIQKNSQCVIQMDKQLDKIPSIKGAYVAVYAEAGNLVLANEILQKEADAGDIESALFLIEQVLFDQIKEKEIMIGEDVDEIVGYKGLSIAWSEDQIHDFLLKRYDAGDEKAKRLLKLQLMIDINDKLGEDKFNTIKRAELIKNAAGYPESIIQEVLNSRCFNELNVSVFPSTSHDNSEEDDLPF